MKGPAGRIAASLLAAVVAAMIVGLTPAVWAVATVNVNCATQNLQTKIDHAPPGSILLIKGTCEGNFHVDKSLTLKGNPTATLDGQSAGSSTLILNGTHNVHLFRLTIIGGEADTRGGGIYRPGGGVLTLNSVSVMGNLAAGQLFAYGGGIDSEHGSTRITNSSIVNNRARGSYSGGVIVAGGGIYTHGPLTMTASRVSSNRAIGVSGIATNAAGGGIEVVGGALRVSSSHLDNNRAIARSAGATLAAGGAIYDGSSGPFSVVRSTFTGDSALASGTGVATASGGAIDSSFDTGVLTGSKFVSNEATATSDGDHADAAGGAIHSLAGAKLSVRSSHISDSALTASGSGVSDSTVAGGGLSSEGRTSIVRSSFSGGTLNVQSTSGEATARGGGIYEAYLSTGDSLSVTRSTVDRNHVIEGPTGFNANGYGGGIVSFAPTRIFSSTVSRNAIKSVAHGSSTAEAHGGGLYLYPGGPSTGYSITNSTIEGNSVTGTASDSSGTTTASGGGLDASLPVAITNATIARNSVSGSGASRSVIGGGFRVSIGPVTLKAVILGLNHALVGPDCYGAASSAGRNLVRKTAGCTFAAKGSDRLHKDPKLGPLADNGGPTKTSALLDGSPALNWIPKAGCAVHLDQRGVKRPQGPRCDIGSYERKV